MISKTRRLPRSEFKAHGYKTIRTPFFSLKTKKNSLFVNRIGVVIGKSVDKRATQRNFWERQAKTELSKLPDRGDDIILIIFPAVSALTKEKFHLEIKKSLSL